MSLQDLLAGRWRIVMTYEEQVFGAIAASRKLSHRPRGDMHPQIMLRCMGAYSLGLGRIWEPHHSVTRDDIEALMAAREVWRGSRWCETGGGLTLLEKNSADGWFASVAAPGAAWVLFHTAMHAKEEDLFNGP